MVELPELDHALQKTEKSLTMYAVMMHSASRRIVPAVLIAVVLAVPAAAQEFAAGEPIGALNEAGVWQPMSDNVTVYGSFHFSESCTFDSNKNLILAMNTGNRGCTAPGFLDTRLRYAAWRSSYSSRASSGVRYASFSRRQHWL